VVRIVAHLKQFAPMVLATVAIVAGAYGSGIAAQDRPQPAPQTRSGPTPADNSAQGAAQTFNRVTYRIPPKDTDPQLQRFLADNYVMVQNGTPPSAPLLVFMPGTSGAPQGTWPVLVAAAKAGYRVIGLEYNDQPAVAQVCEPRDDASCSGRFREKRIFGDGDFPYINDTPEESIVHRLTMLLRYLDAHHPEEQWGGYFTNGELNWTRIAVSGHSQGAGMAALIAKQYLVDRVILFSCPWDYYGPTKTLAPWLKDPSATPPERWYAAYHKRERQAETLKRAYKVLKVPDDHVRVFALEPNLEPLHGHVDASMDAYHVSEVSPVITPRMPDGTPAYAADYAFLLGEAK
jgi:pimeloyl-ACP methyl ester carboxylesterase